MLYRCLSVELKPHGILVGSVRPGIIETAMQVEIRSASKQNMPDVDQFHKLKANEYQQVTEEGVPVAAHKPPLDGLDTVENVALFTKFLLTETTGSEFIAEEWDIRNEEHHNRWVPPAV